jgi:hypothetical protein
VALLRDVLDAFTDPGAPRWTALERLLRPCHHPLGEHATPPRSRLRPRRLAVYRTRLQLAPESSRPSHPLPLPRRRQPPRQPHGRLRRASPARHPRRHDPRVRHGSARDRMVPRRAARRAAVSRLRRGSSLRERRACFDGRERSLTRSATALRSRG